MRKPPSKPSTRPNLAPALEAARLGDEDSCTQALEGVQLRDGPEASLDEVWLLAELAHLDAHRTDAIRRFEEFERRAARSPVPAWQRFGSAHRRMIAFYGNGEYQHSMQLLVDAERIIAENPELRFRQANIDAMYGHFLELKGDLEAAKARFVVGFQIATEFGHWSRAASIASDVARIAVDQQDYLEALKWFEEARKADDHEPSRRVRQVIDVRLAKLYRLMGRMSEAHNAFDLATRDPIPDRDVNALLERAELVAEQGHYEAGELDLKHAIELCEERGVGTVAMAAYRSLAKLYLARAAKGDDGSAAQAFARHADLALSTKPVQLGLLVELAKDVLAEPGLIGRSALPEPLATPLRAAHAECLAHLEPAHYGRALRAARASAALHHLEAELKFLKAPAIHLEHWDVLPVSRDVLPKGGKADKRRISDAEFLMLHHVLGAPREGWTMTDLADLLDKSIGATTKSCERLKKLIKPDLVMTRRKGDLPRYSVRKAASPDGG